MNSLLPTQSGSPKSDRRFIGWRHSSANLLSTAIIAWSAPLVVSAADWFPERFSMTPPPVAARNLLELSLDELATIKVTSVSKAPELLFEAPAAISVLTADDIRRSGAHSIPDALRLVPGVNVAQQDAHTFAISARGSSDAFANKLLVLMDGRSVYSPLFSGVLWDAQDTVLEDIDRIEVIRGPGATLWGANAVNGVINVITKNAKDTLGFLGTGGAGSEEQGFGSVRYGVKVGDNAWVRIFGKYDNRDNSSALGGGDGLDDWRTQRGGFRFDWEPTKDDSVTLQGDIYDGTEGQVFTVPLPSPPPQLPPGIPISLIPPELLAALQVPVIGQVDRDTDISGGNVLGRWSHAFSEHSSAEIRAYYDRTNRDTSVFTEERDTFDVEFQHRFSFTAGIPQEVTWGLGYRRTDDRTTNSLSISLDPPDATDELWNGFVQDKLTLAPSLHLTLGTKIEHNDYTGWEWQPSARLVWMPVPAQTLWASVSRAVRTPARFETGAIVNLPGQVPGVGTIRGNPGFRSEELLAYELGWRVQLHHAVNVDLALFYNDYAELRTARFDITTLQANLINGYEGEAYGGELSAQWQATGRWRLIGGYSYLDENLRPNTNDPAVQRNDDSGSSPHNQWFLRSMLDLPGRVTLDLTGRYVDSLPSRKVDAYFTMDARLGWSVNDQVEVAVVGRNLLDDRHQEFAPSALATQRTEVERSVFGQVTIRF